jgi:hypothetical protein
MNKSAVDTIVQHIGNTMPTFGGGRTGDPTNPISTWAKDQPLMFALGVDVRTVVEFTLAEAAALARRQKAAKKAKG